MTLPLNIVPKPTLELSHHKIHEGNHFTVHKITTAPGPGPKYFLIIPPPVQPDGSVIEIHIIFEIDLITAGVGGTLEFFENPTIAGPGATLNTVNNNRRSATISQVQVFEDPAVTFDNPPSLFEGKISGPGAVGEFSRNEEEFVLNELFNYVLKLTPTAFPSEMNLDLNWYDNRPSSPV